MPFLVDVGPDAPQPFLLPFLHAIQEDGDSPTAGDKAVRKIEAKLAQMDATAGMPLPTVQAMESLLLEEALAELD